MIPAKPNWKKLTHWLSPLLVLSLGLHGLMLLVPVPKKAEIMEEPPETELLEPIQVSTLPKLSLSEATSEPTAIAPSGGAPSEPQRLLESVPPAPLPASAAPRPSPQAATPAPSSAPRPPSDQTADPGAADPGNPADGTPSDRPQKTDPIPQAYNEEGTSPGEASAEISNILDLYQTDETPVSLKFVKHDLPLAFPSDDFCFKDYLEPPASVVVIVENTQSGLEAVDGNLTQRTGYAAIDKWINKSVFPTSQVDPNANEVKIPDVADVDILEWIINNIDGPVLESGEQLKAYTFGVKVTLVENPCE